jgi:hypothetical protein
MKTEPNTLSVIFVLKTGQKFEGILPDDYLFKPESLTYNTVHRISEKGRNIFVQGDNIAYVEVL